MVSIGLNICLLESNKRLVYRVQKLEAGTARGLFIKPDEKVQAPLTDEELNELIKEMLQKIAKERLV